MNKINIEKLEYLRKQQEKLRKHDSTNQNNNYYESNIEKYKRRCIEYIEFLKTTKRNIGVYDEIYFSDGIDMYSWFIYYDQKFNKEREIEEIPTGERLEKLICFANIYNELNDIKKLKKTI